MRFCEASFAFVDVETTGLRPGFDGVCEVAVLVVRGDRRVAAYEALVDPGRPIPWFASAVHGLDDGDVRGAPALHELVPRLRRITEDAVVVAHNLAFDLGFLPFLADRRTLCSLRFARATVPCAPDYRNQTLRRHLGIAVASDAHRAAADVSVTAAIFAHCVRRYLGTGAPDDVDEAIARVMRRRAA